MASILLVDDEESPRATLALLLKQAGHDVVQAEGVVAAAEALAAAAFDLVITDLRMPEGDGLEVIRRTRSTRPDAEVIVVTAYAGWESAKEAMRLGAFDYFEKGREPGTAPPQAGGKERLAREREPPSPGAARQHAASSRSTRCNACCASSRVASSDATALIEGSPAPGRN
jgi:DNA-binding NtrC family response regulator